MLQAWVWCGQEATRSAACPDGLIISERGPQVRSGGLAVAVDGDSVLAVALGGVQGRVRTRQQVGDFDTWVASRRSDHVPLIVEVKDDVPGV